MTDFEELVTERQGEAIESVEELQEVLSILGYLKQQTEQIQPKLLLEANIERKI